MGDDMKVVDPHRASRGGPIAVLPAGAVVHIAADYEQQRALNAPNAPLASRNPWVLVEVSESPVPAQRGWKGWIHLATTAAAAPAHAPALGNETLPRASLLCPYADAIEAACTVSIPARSTVRVLGCSGPRAHVELWTAEGLYLDGFVSATQLSNPCTTASKE
jgi:hypothetical protein